MHVSAGWTQDWEYIMRKVSSLLYRLHVGRVHVFVSVWYVRGVPLWGDQCRYLVNFDIFFYRGSYWFPVPMYDSLIYSTTSSCTGHACTYLPMVVFPLTIFTGLIDAMHSSFGYPCSLLSVWTTLLFWVTGADPASEEYSNTDDLHHHCCKKSPASSSY